MIKIKKKKIDINEINKKVLSMILGGVVGDALGVPFEFKIRDSFKATEMIGYGTYKQPIGTWSDDTSLTMCLIENILNNGNEKDLLNKFSKYLDEGYWTPFGHYFDIGTTTRISIENYKKGVSVNKCGMSGEYANGNGALMRISPLVPFLLNNNNIDYKFNVINKICCITHSHYRSTLGCIIYIEFMINLFNGYDKLEAYKRTKKEIKKYINKDIFKSEIMYYDRILKNDIYNYKREEIYSTGYVVYTLEAVMWCFFKHNNYEDIILEAVNLGDDTDTIAFIVGTMAGLYYGINNIPKNWLSNIKKLDEITLKCNEFSKYICKNIL